MSYLSHSRFSRRARQRRLRVDPGLGLVARYYALRTRERLRRWRNGLLTALGWR